MSLHPRFSMFHILLHTSITNHLQNDDIHTKGDTMNPITRKIYKVLQQNGFINSYIISVSKDTNSINATIQLPANKEQSDLEGLQLNLQQELNALDSKLIKSQGKQLTLSFGFNNLTNITYNSSYLQPNTLRIRLPSAFGYCTLDFSDGASCHLLNGGTTRMGKTSFLLYLATVLYIQTNGEIKLYITSTKAKDFYPFDGLQGTQIAKSINEFTLILEELTTEYKHRNDILYSPTLRKATDAKSVIKLYPAYAHHFKPIFLIIDEYARFSDNKEIQKKVMELVETAGYVNIHVIISTQRPDARTVLNPRIKSNLLARICFTTADKNNSIVILDKEGAENLGKIEGRAILSDTDMNIVQIPHITPEQSETLLSPYRKEVKLNENIESPARQTNQDVAAKIQNLFKESIGNDGFLTEHDTNQHSKPSNEKTRNGWFLLESRKTKR